MTDDRTSPDEVSGSDDLEEYLNALERDTHYHVEKVLKETAGERTELVYYINDHGVEQGPYIRKIIARAEGVGSAYTDLYHSQQLGHRFDHFPRIIGYYETADQLVVVMEYVAGRTLRDVILDTEPDDRFDLTIQIFPELCKAVNELHSIQPHPIIHRDIKPSNIICSEDDPPQIKIIDLGIARQWRPDAEEDTTHFGTRPYAPPEQFGFGQTDARTDIYALGLVLFFCLTGRDATTADRESHYTDLAIGKECRKVIERATAWDPADRYFSVQELEAAFIRAAAADKKTEEEWPNEQMHAGKMRGASEAKKQRGFFESLGIHINVPNWVGRIWDFVIVVVYIFLLSACIAASIGPGEANIAWPTAFRVYAYAIFLNLIFLALLFILYDTRRLRERFTSLKKLTYLRRFLIGVGVIAVDVVVFFLIGMAVAPTIASNEAVEEEVEEQVLEEVQEDLEDELAEEESVSSDEDGVAEEDAVSDGETALDENIEMASEENMLPASELTLGQQNASSAAQRYLSVMPFSYAGLITQLEYDGYTSDEAVWAADTCGADWNQQAAAKARDYLNVMSFSRIGLIDQLVYDGFTEDQAVYAVDAVGC